MHQLPNFPKPIKNLMPMFLTLSHETEREEMRVLSPPKSSIVLRSMQQPERNHKQVSQMNTNAKIFSIESREREFKNTKKTSFHDQIGSIPRGQVLVQHMQISSIVQLVRILKDGDYSVHLD